MTALTAENLDTIRYHLCKGVSERVVASWFGLSRSDLRAQLQADVTPPPDVEPAPAPAQPQQEPQQSTETTSTRPCEQAPDQTTPVDAGEGSDIPAPPKRGRGGRPRSAGAGITEDTLRRLLIDQGLSFAVAAERLGTTRNTVAGLANRFGISKGNGVGGWKHAKRKADRLTLADLTPEMCRWPNGTPRTEGFHFCGAQAVDGRPYCAEHVARAYIGRPAR